MARQLVVAVLLGGLVGFVPLTASAQIARTGPAALAQRMPTIYGPYLANMSRVRILHARGGLNPASYTGINRHKGQVPAGRQPSPRSSTAEPPSANLDTTFQVVRPAFVPQQLAARLGKTPQERREIEAVLTKCLLFYTDNARQKGVPLNDVARALNAAVDLPAMLARALEKVAELLGLSTGWVLLFDETGEPYTAAALNLPAGLRDEPKLLAGWCYCLELLDEGDLDGAANIGVISCSRLRKLALAKGVTAGLRYHASVPLEVSAEGELRRLGMLNVAGPEWHELDTEELKLLHTIGDMLSVGIERARLHARRLEAAQTEERNRLAREIHDTIAQDFSAIAFQLEAAEALLEQQAEPERIRRSVSAALGLSRKGLEEARRSVLDLRAAPLEGRTLPEALAALAAGSGAVFEAAAPVDALPPAVEIGLYRIAQEALQNALRHAAASRILIRLEAREEMIRLTIEDNGQGFMMGEAGGHFGLVGMQERTRLLGGNLQVQSSPGAGTRITAEAPLGGRPFTKPSVSSSPTIIPWSATGSRPCWRRSRISRS